MTVSLTKDYEYKVYTLVEHIIQKIIIPNPLTRYQDDGNGDVEAVDDDGELASALEDFLLHFIQEIEDCSSFEAEKQLPTIIYNLTTQPKNIAYLYKWIGFKATGTPQWTGD